MEIKKSFYVISRADFLNTEQFHDSSAGTEFVYDKGSKFCDLTDKVKVHFATKIMHSNEKYSLEIDEDNYTFTFKTNIKDKIRKEEISNELNNLWIELDTSDYDNAWHCTFVVTDKAETKITWNPFSNSLKDLDTLVEYFLKKFEEYGINYLTDDLISNYKYKIAFQAEEALKRQISLSLLDETMEAVEDVINFQQ